MKKDFRVSTYPEQGIFSASSRALLRGLQRITVDEISFGHNQLSFKVKARRSEMIAPSISSDIDDSYCGPHLLLSFKELV
jgi:hypothetical protein